MLNFLNQAKINNKSPALHIYNLIFLVLSYCTYKIHDPVICPDRPHERFLNWILYGNIIIYGIAFIFYVLFKIGLLDFCTEKCFNAVCVALNTIGFFGGIIIYNMVSMVYSLILYFGVKSSECMELELFTKFSAYVIIIFFSVNLLILIYVWLSNRISNKGKELYSDYYEMDNKQLRKN